VDEWVLGVSLWGLESSALVSKEPSCEIVAFNDSEDSAVHVKVETKVQVGPDVAESGIFWSGNLVPFQKDTLGNA
jgi:hypothetical protein